MKKKQAIIMLVNILFSIGFSTFIIKYSNYLVSDLKESLTDIGALSRKIHYLGTKMIFMCFLGVSFYIAASLISYIISKKIK